MVTVRERIFTQFRLLRRVSKYVEAAILELARGLQILL